MELYNDLGGDNWKNNSGWGSGSVITNDWYGVEVDENNRVITLDLAGGPMKGEGVIGGNNLSGNRLTPKLGNLKRVEYINLKQNNIVGATLPAEWVRMSNLKELYIAGAIPLVHWKFGMTSIKDNNFDESTNIIEGQLPPEWGNMQSIERIEISFTSSQKDSNDNFFGGISGDLPLEWGNMKTLKSLILNGNLELGGNLPLEWGNLTELNHLHIGGTQRQQPGFQGEIPSEWGGDNNYAGMRKLTDLRISGDFDNSFPDSWKNLKMLWFVSVTGFKGEFPEWLGNGDFHNRIVVNDPDPDAMPVEAYHSGLGTFSGGGNKFTGNFPDFSNLTWLNTFRVSFSNINGDFPTNASGLTRLIQFDINGNGVAGKIPNLSSWGRLRFIDVPNNNLEGVLPNLDTNNSEFRNSQWQNNNFSGSIPESWNFPGSNEIFRLWLHNNELSGPIPERLADPGHSYSSGFRVDGNRYLFKDLVPFIELGPNNFTYAPQKPFGTARTVTQAAGQRVDLEFPEVSHPDNRYQWVKNGSDISGATSRTLTISSMSESDQGTYTLRVTNPKAPDLTLTSVGIELVLGDGSGDTNEPQQPDTPALLNPSDNSTDLSLSPTFEWSDVAADNYLFQIDKINSIVRVADESTTGTSLVLPDELDYLSDYRWRVKAVKDGVESEWSSYREFRTQEEPLSVPGIPVLINPDESAENIEINPSFGWQEVTEADSYRLQVAESSEFTNPETDLQDLSGTSAQVENLGFGTLYFWRVQAVNEAGGSEWSEVRSFQTEAEPEPLSIPGETQLLSPETGATGLSRSPSLSWSQVSDAETYTIQLSLSQTFETLVNDLSGVGGTGVTVSGLNFETEYFWRVRAVNEAGTGGWSGTRSFTTLDEPLAEPGVPVLVSPSAGATDVSRSPLLDWDVAANAATYNLQVSTSQAFETLETDETDIFESEFSVSGLDFETIYYWRVKAVNETGESSWSQTRLFTTLDEPLSAPSSPGLLLPEANSTEVSRSPELSWGTPADAETYRVQVSVTSGFGSPVVDLDNVSESGIIAENLNYSTTYFWRVLAANDAGQSSWSEIRSFTTREQPLLPPPAPQLVSPQSGSEEISSINHTFTWNETEGAERYRLQFSIGNNSFSPSIDIENISDISRTIEGLEPETTYLWRVQARNGAGSSEWSEIWFFVTDEAAPLPSLPLANSTNVELAPSFTWNSLNADEYILQVNRANTGETVVEESVADTTFTVTSELSPLTVYRWRVKAVRDSVEGDWGPSIAFTTGNPDGDSGNDDDNGDEDDGNDGDDGLGDNRDEEITTIEQNYPNPFNPSTVIQFRLAEAQQVSLKIYNLAGQRVATLVSEPLSAGTHSRVFDAAGLASGIYFYRLITERNVFTKKMTLIK